MGVSYPLSDPVVVPVVLDHVVPALALRHVGNDVTAPSSIAEFDDRRPLPLLTNGRRGILALGPLADDGAGAALALVDGPVLFLAQTNHVPAPTVERLHRVVHSEPSLDAAPRKTAPERCALLVVAHVGKPVLISPRFKLRVQVVEMHAVDGARSALPRAGYFAVDRRRIISIPICAC